MADSLYVADGQVYPDEATAVVANHPNIPDDLKRLYVSPKQDDSAAGMASQASEKAADALKQAQGTKPSLDSDTSLRGSVVAGTPDYLRNLGIDTTITSDDIEKGMALGTSFSGGGLSTKDIPAYGWTKTPGLAYEQMGDTGKFEVYNPTTGLTHATFDTAEEARSYKPDVSLADTPGTPEFNQKHGYLTDEGVKSAIDEIEKILNQMDAEQNAKYPVTQPGQPISAKKIPITEGGKSPILSVEEPYKQVPLYYHEKTASWENYPEEVQKMSQKDAFLKGIQEARANFKATMSNILQTFKPAFEAKRPIVAPRGNYTEPAYRGLTVYGPNASEGANPVFNFDKGQALYSTAHPELADMYASYLDKHPGYMVPPGTFADTAQVQPLLIDTRDYLKYDAKGAHWTEANGKAIAEAHAQGKKGVIVDNVYDEPNSTRALKKPKKVYITFKSGAGTVKSRFAQKFDPSSPNMLHSIGIGTAGLGYVSYPDDNSDN